MTYAGIRANGFKDQQKRLLVELIEEYVGNMKEVISHFDNTWKSIITIYPRNLCCR